MNRIGGGSLGCGHQRVNLFTVARQSELGWQGGGIKPFSPCQRQTGFPQCRDQLKSPFPVHMVQGTFQSLQELVSGVWKETSSGDLRLLLGTSLLRSAWHLSYLPWSGILSRKQLAGQSQEASTLYGVPLCWPWCHLGPIFFVSP